MSPRELHLLLTGRPGVGKTTVLRTVAERLEGERIAGFLTEEIREGGRRVGFRGIPLGVGEAVTISHVDFSGPTVGKYGVDVGAVDRLVEANLENGEPDLYLVDEIGKMECLSERFVDRMDDLLDGSTPVVATVGRGNRGLMGEAKERDGVEIIEVTRENRDELPGTIADRVRER
ncbi:MAG: NTPase [Gemmatimonadota bacterium]|nr:NTPase [Gemmatimonadota bacterium]